jgi:hypothetical protein
VGDINEMAAEATREYVAELEELLGRWLHLADGGTLIHPAMDIRKLIADTHATLFPAGSPCPAV